MAVVRKPLLGAHMSIAGGFHKAVEAAATFAMDVVQIFTASPSQWAVSPTGDGDAVSPSHWRAKPLDPADVERFQQSLDQRKIAHPIAHSSYLINLASPDPTLWRRSIEAMRVELLRAEQLGVPYVVMHPGAHVTASEAEGLENIARAIDELHDRLPAGAAQILLENTAGQGSNLGWRFEHLASILEKIAAPERVGVCFDTCHAFAAGYPLAEPRDYKTTFKMFDDLVGIDKIRAFHLNDSKRELGSHVDRHERIGAGHLGVEPFRHLLNDRRFRPIPMYLETPKGLCDGEELDAINLRLLRSLVE